MLQFAKEPIKAADIEIIGRFPIVHEETNFKNMKT